MNELSPRRKDNESLEIENPQPELDKERILDTLFYLRDRYELDLEKEDQQDLLGEDDKDFLSNLATLALMHDIDYEDFFIELGVPAVYIIDISDHLEITGETE